MQQPTRDNLTEELFEPMSVRAYVAPVDPNQIDRLRPDEASALTPMSPGRQAEFATARACARAALADLGTTASVPKRQAGSPAWPLGMTGSISHTKGYCVAVASRGSVTLGIDVEEIHRMTTAVERRILVDAERELLGDLGDQDRQRRVASIFAAKEAFYKAHFEIDPRYLGFDVIAVTVDDAELSFAPSSGDVGADIINRAFGRVRYEHGRVIAGVAIDTVGIETRLPSHP